MNLLLIIICIVVGLYLFFRIKGSLSKHNAAMNALVAKATYQKMDKDLQKQVIDRTLFILQQDGGFSASQDRLDKMGEKQKYGFFALAMAELSIEPLSRKWKWYLIRNPFVALIKAEKEIKMAQSGLKAEGIEVNLSD